MEDLIKFYKDYLFVYPLLMILSLIGFGLLYRREKELVFRKPFLWYTAAIFFLFLINSITTITYFNDYSDRLLLAKATEFIGLIFYLIETYTFVFFFSRVIRSIKFISFLKYFMVLFICASIIIAFEMMAVKKINYANNLTQTHCSLYFLMLLACCFYYFYEKYYYNEGLELMDSLIILSLTVYTSLSSPFLVISEKIRQLYPLLYDIFSLIHLFSLALICISIILYSSEWGKNVYLKEREDSSLTT